MAGKPFTYSKLETEVVAVLRIAPSAYQSFVKMSSPGKSKEINSDDPVSFIVSLPTMLLLKRG